MKKRLKQSTVSNVMAIISCSMALFIFIAGMLTSLLFFETTGLNSDRAKLSSHIRHLITVVNYQKDMSRSYTQEGNSLFLDMYNNGLDETGQVDSILTDMEALTADPMGQQQLQNISKHVRAMQAAEQDIISLAQSGRLEEAKALAFGEDYGVTNDGFNQAIDEFEEGMSRGIGAIIEKRSNKIMMLGISIEILCVMLIAIQITNALILRKQIIKPLVKLKDGMIEMCEGHLSGTLDVQVDQTEMGLLAGAMLDMRSRISDYIKEIDFVLHSISQKDISVQVTNQYVGDFQPIHSSLNLIIASLSETFVTLSNSIDQVSSGAEHVSHAAQALAQGAAEQASSVELLSHSIEQVSTQINDNSANATETNQLAVTAGSSLSSSNQQMEMMIDAMSEISASSSEISKIIKTIEDIAFQTNILALNAAVEAARAGEAGKGFAVVADEVRNLATKSSEAAKQTNILIENSVQSVESGVKIVNETAQSLSEVVSSSLQMADRINKISQVCGDQSTSITHINQNVDQISSVVQTNSATSEESAAASEELSSQANMMKSMVHQYKWKQ